MFKVGDVIENQGIIVYICDTDESNWGKYLVEVIYNSGWLANDWVDCPFLSNKTRQFLKTLPSDKCYLWVDDWQLNGATVTSDDDNEDRGGLKYL
jgi:hypothetical protein